MKAAVFHRGGGPDVLQYLDMPDPAPGDGELLIRVEAISIEGGDLLARQRQDPGGSPQIPGYAAAGGIVALGAGVTDFSVGQKVTTCAPTGSHAELRVAPATTTWKVPQGLSMPLAAATPCGPGTAALAMAMAGVKAGDNVLVQGAAGGVGIAALQLANRAGARVMGTGSNASSLEALRMYGLTDPIVIGKEPIEKQVHSLLNGHGADVLIDNVGGLALRHALPAVRDGARIVLIGAQGGFDETIGTMEILLRRLIVIGCYLGPIMGEPVTHSLITDVLQQVTDGELQVPIDQTFSLSDAAAAHARAEERGRIGRVIIVP